MLFVMLLKLVAMRVHYCRVRAVMAHNGQYAADHQ
jgi:hypothetical protein